MLCPFKFNRARVIKEDSGCEEKSCSFYIIDKEETVTNGRNEYRIIRGHCCIKDLSKLQKTGDV